MTVMRRPLLLAALTLSTFTAQARGYDAAAWQRDYTELKNTLEQRYANLAWFASPEGGVDLPRLDHLTRQTLRAARSDDEARRAIESFVKAFKDGHFSVLPDLAAPTGVAPEVPAKPFDKTNPAASCAALGFLPIARVAFSLPLESLPDFQLLGDGLATVYRAGLATMADGQKVGVLRIQNFYKEAFPANCLQGFAWLKAEVDIIDEKSLRDAADHRWLAGLAEQIAELKASGMTTLLVDVGNNSGGNDSGDLFPRLLTDKPVQSSRLRIGASTAANAYASEQLASLDAALKSSPPAEARDALIQAREFFVQVKVQATQPCDMAWAWTQRRPWASKGCKRLIDVGYAGGFAPTLPRGAFGDQNVAYRLSYPSSADDLWAMWTGPLYVLTDARTYSSAEMFAAVVQDNHIGKTVGANTGGDGCGFMNSDTPKMLSYSRIRIRIPDCTRLRFDGRDEVAGIAPDLPVLPTEGEDDRQRAVRLLEAVAADVRNR